MARLLKRKQEFIDGTDDTVANKRQCVEETEAEKPSLSFSEFDDIIHYVYLTREERLALSLMPHDCWCCKNETPEGCPICSVMNENKSVHPNAAIDSKGNYHSIAWCDFPGDALIESVCMNGNLL